MRTETSILLPSATVDLFLKDHATMEAAKALEGDWRFARVTIRINEGNVENAIELYSETASPEILMIETDTTDDSFIARLGELSGHCKETTSAVIIGPVNDVNLYRKLTAMGVSDYLVRPVPMDTLGDVIAQSLIEKLGTSGSRLIAVVGAKGGVGASSIAQIMAWGASDKLNQKTLLMDGAGAWSSLGVGIGFEPVASTAEAIKAVSAKDADSLRRMLYQASDKLAVLATGTEPMLESPATIGQFEEILNMTMTSYPLVIVDLSAAIPAVKKAVLTRAHEIVIVTAPTLSSLRSARASHGDKENPWRRWREYRPDRQHGRPCAGQGSGKARYKGGAGNGPADCHQFRSKAVYRSGERRQEIFDGQRRAGNRRKDSPAGPEIREPRCAGGGRIFR